MYQITPIPAFKDNYIWLLNQPGSDKATVVDPGDAAPVLEYLQNHGLQLANILVTHHHWDHSGGIPALKARYDCRVFGPAGESIEGLDQRLREGDEISLDDPDTCFRILDIPAHTSGHIAFVDEKNLFCGDTLFAAGCGRLFEGSAAQMWHSLCKLAALPDATRVYCGHEYTLANLQFARQADPDNHKVIQRLEKVARQRDEDQVTLPSTIGLERETNPFLRCHLPPLASVAAGRSDATPESPEQVLAVIRAWKDQF